MKQMKQNNFYEVDGCTDFIPVKLIEEHKHMTNTLKVELTETGDRAFVPHMYSFPKVNEPQKVTVPMFVAEWIEECKRSGWHLQKVLSRLDDDEKVGDWAYYVNDDLISEKVDMIARAWLDGFEIEKEKLYFVEIPNPNSKDVYNYFLKKDSWTGKVVLFKCSANPRNNKDLWLTESEIKQDFEWAWQWAKEVE